MSTKFKEAEDLLYIVRQAAKKKGAYDDKKPTDDIKKTVEKMVAAADNWEEASNAYAVAKTHNHQLKEAVAKMIEKASTEEEAENTLASAKKQDHMIVDAYDKTISLKGVTAGKLMMKKIFR